MRELDGVAEQDEAVRVGNARRAAAPGRPRRAGRRAGRDCPGADQRRRACARRRTIGGATLGDQRLEQHRHPARDDEHRRRRLLDRVGGVGADHHPPCAGLGARAHHQQVDAAVAVDHLGVDAGGDGEGSLDGRLVGGAAQDTDGADAGAVDGVVGRRQRHGGRSALEQRLRGTPDANVPASRAVVRAEHDHVGLLGDRQPCQPLARRGVHDDAPWNLGRLQPAGAALQQGVAPRDGTSPRRPGSGGPRGERRRASAVRRHRAGPVPA